MGNFLQVPSTEKHGLSMNTSWGSIGVAGMQGWRIEMEDSHIICTMPSLPDHTFLAVFDGHGGDGAAKFAAAKMISVMEDSYEWCMYKDSTDKDPELIGTAIRAAFIQLDEDLKHHQNEEASGVTKGNVPSSMPGEERGDKSKDTSGCTAITCMVTPLYYVCCNTGDSRCVIGTDEVSIPLSEDHKPTNKGEQMRIEKAGGAVQWKRIDGDLAVSRAIGDFSFKTRDDLLPEEQKVSCVPDITVRRRNATDKYLLLACDGVWDVMGNSEAIGHLREIIGSGESDMLLVAEEMLDIALNKGSTDNISAVVAYLGKEITQGGGVLQRRLQREYDECLAADRSGDE